ncbi:hypothetical protein [Caldimonas sp. KR1-144]|uniref:hypothetical protein n=1 Tax=Caldimonas sp. KR1-144 TaxID=3400911 RepID=UPI003C01474F
MPEAVGSRADSPWLQLLLRSLACAALSAAVYRWLGLIPSLSTAVVWGFALARPLAEAGADAVQRLRAHAWRDLEGHHHSIAGHPVRVIEEGGHAWLNLRDLRRALELDTDGEPELGAQVAAFRGRWRAMGPQHQPFVRADAALAWMASHPRGTEPRWGALRKRIERDIVHPAARRAGRDSASPLSRHTAPPRPATPAPPTVRDAPAPQAHRGQSTDGDQETQGPGPRP